LEPEGKTHPLEPEREDIPSFDPPSDALFEPEENPSPLPFSLNQKEEHLLFSNNDIQKILWGFLYRDFP